MSGTAAPGAGAGSGGSSGSHRPPRAPAPADNPHLPEAPDLEQQQPQVQQEQQAQQHEEPKAAKRWPQLRLSSVSTRRVQQPDPDGDLLSPLASGEGSLLAPLLSGSTPRRSLGGLASPPASGPLLSPRGNSVPMPSPFHTATAVLLEEQPPPAPAAPGHEGAPGGAAAGLPGQTAHSGKQVQAAGEQGGGGGRLTRAAIVGGINAVVSLPVMLSFAAIIYRVRLLRGRGWLWARGAALRRGAAAGVRGATPPTKQLALCLVPEALSWQEGFSGKSECLPACLNPSSGPT